MRVTSISNGHEISTIARDMQNRSNETSDTVSNSPVRNKRMDKESMSVQSSVFDIVVNKGFMRSIYTVLPVKISIVS